MSQGTHSYYEWQLSTLMLAYDATDPKPRDDVEAIGQRQMHCENELYELSRAIIPAEFLENPERELPPEITRDFTRAVIARAAQITGLID
ncbi:MAG: hypothetical protein ACFCVE_01450 [Phycisphaerae bacterium]